MQLKGAKKGQGGMEISILVILIAMFILIYVILLPPAERAELLDGDTPETSGDMSVLAESETIFSESPGKVFSYSSNRQTSKIEPLHLYSKENTENTILAKALTVSRNLLKDNYRNIIFNIEDTGKISNLRLFMLVSESRGRLTIKLNDHIVYQGHLTSEQMPISLPLEYLKKSNKLELSLNIPGVSEFYKTNYYLLQDISLIRTFKTVKTDSERIFFIDMEEGQKVRKAELRYIINCNELEPRGSLTIKLNSRLQSRDIVFCEYSDEIILPLDSEDLKEDGRNKLSFSIDKGDYNLDQVRVITELGKSIYPKYVFDIDSETHSDLISDEKKLVLRMKFNSDGRKKATVFMQDSQFSFDVSAGEYSKDITGIVDNGANFIKLVPKNNFEISSLRISLEEVEE